MARWSRYLARAVHSVERAVDKGKAAVKRHTMRDPLLVFPYLTYGTRERVLVKGRVLEDKGLRRSRADDSVWSNVANAIKRFDSDEVPDAEVRIRLGAADALVRTDHEGFFETWLELPTPLPDAAVHDVAFELLAPHPSKQERTDFEGQVVVPPSDARFGVISDVDDTVLVSNATSTLSLAKKVLFGNARTRLPFGGVAAFYEALNRDRNPIFYVSSSPWNLYDVLAEFLELNDIPLGPLLLRDWGITAEELLPTRHGRHKHDAIEAILETYPELPFLLIGDSGQEDPEIYREVARRHPGQILAVYIRDVDEGEARRSEVDAIRAELAEEGVPMVIAADTVRAAEHAAEQGWIEAADVDAVRRGRARDADAGADS